MSQDVNADVAQQRLALLVKASELLSSSLIPSQTLAHLARLAVPFFADICTVDLIAEDGQVQAVHVAHVDPTKEDLARRARDAYDPLKAPRDGREVLWNSQPTLIREFTDDYLRAFASSPEHLELTRALGTRSLITVPLVARGQTLGLINLATSESGRRYSEADLNFAEELARRAAVAIDNSRLHAAEQRARQAAERAADRTARLQALTAALAGALTPAQVAEVIDRQCLSALGASGGVLAIRGRGDATIEVIGKSSFPHVLVDKYKGSSVDARNAVATALRTGLAVWIESPEAWAASYPDIADGELKGGAQALACIPMIIDGRAVGAIGLSFSQPQAFTTEDQAFLLTLARQCAQALERARLYEAEKAARAEAEAERARTAFLSEASAHLATSLDATTILEALTRVSISVFCTSAVVARVDADGSLHCLSVAHADPSKQALLRRMKDAPLPDLDHPLGVVARTGKSQLLADVDPSLLFTVDQSFGHQGPLRELSGWSAIAVPLTIRDEILGVLCFGLVGRAYTLADLAVAEELARRAALALDNARLYRDVQEASRLKDEFLSIVSHELRTPLNAIIGWSRMLRTGSVREGNREHALDIIERNASLQTRLIDDLLDVSRIIAGKLRLEITPTDVVPVIETVVESVSPAVLAKDLQLTKKLNLVNRPVLADASRLKQIVWNLVINAIKFTPKGGKIEVNLDCNDEEARIVVSDNGLGIPPSFLPHVFDRFRQADATLTRQSSGLGLGLAIVRYLVEAHGGTVRAESAGVNLGATFTVKIPLARNEHLAGVVATSSPDPALHWTPMLTGTSVLVVEDQDDTREILEEVLLQAGAAVKVAADAREAMEILHGWTPDVLVSDIAMPGEDGYSLIRRVRMMEMRQGRSISAVALTAYARAEDRVQALAAGYHMHVPKPVDPRELVLTISSLAARPKSPPPSGKG